MQSQKETTGESRREKLKTLIDASLMSIFPDFLQPTPILVLKTPQQIYQNRKVSSQVPKCSMEALHGLLKREQKINTIKVSYTTFCKGKNNI